MIAWRRMVRGVRHGVCHEVRQSTRHDARRVLLLVALLCQTAGFAAPIHAQTAPTTALPPVQKPPVRVPAKAPPVRKATTLPAVVGALPPAPNIIVLLVDDVGWQDVSVPFFRDTTDANRRINTPAIARLAREGVAFTNAYASAPVGTPSVVTLLTGRSPARTRVTDDSLSMGRDRARSAPGLQSPAWNFAGLSAAPTVANTATAPLLPKLLRTAGYRTAYIGAPRWSATGVVGADARSLGFDESSATTMNDDSIAVITARVIDAARVARKPAFVFVAFDAPPPRDASTTIEAFVAHVELVDERVGQILAHIDSAPPSERTILVLLSDNGGRAPTVFPNAPLRGRMGSAYEGALRIPFLVRWPSVAQRGLRSATPIIIDDLFPTLLRAARVPNVALQMRGAIGQDLTSTFDGSKPLPPDRPLFWHYPHAGQRSNDGAEPFSAVRSGPWKLIYFYASSRYELYNLADDIGESRELSLRQPKIAAPLSEQLRAALIAADARMPVDSVYRKPLGLPGRILVLREPQ